MVTFYQYEKHDEWETYIIKSEGEFYKVVYNNKLEKSSTLEKIDEVDIYWDDMVEKKELPESLINSLNSNYSYIIDK